MRQIFGKDLDKTKKILVKKKFTTSLVNSMIAKSQMKILQMKVVQKDNHGK